jgi:dehydrogenase/reductase SDR family protein 1
MATHASLNDQVVLVTGASRGIGKGIAVQFGEAGCTVYVTGRKPENSDASNNTALPTLEATAAEVTKRGGKGIAVYCDHSDMADVKTLFERIDKEQSGKLDILVNNAYAAVNAITRAAGKKFYEQDVEMWDTVNVVGLKNHYHCSVYAARMMIKRKSGLIVTVSSGGGLRYLFNVPYGVGKAACDRLAGDMGVELRKHNITSISLWPGAVKTELVTSVHKETPIEDTPANVNSLAVRKMFENGETTEFSGLCLRHFAADSARIQQTGKVVMTGDLAYDYGLVDINGRTIPSLRMVKGLLNMSGHTWAAAVTPTFVRLPGWVISAMNSKL